MNGTAVLYITSVVLTLITGLLTWRNTYYLGYIPSYQDNLGWKWVLIPLFGLLIGAVSYIFAKTLRNINHKDESAVISNLRGFRTAAFILLGSLLVGSFVLVQSYKTLEQAKTEAAVAARQEWYEMLADINQELMQISKEILEKPDPELAELTRHDSKAGEVLRSRINAFVDKYMEETEKLFKSTY